MRALLAAVVALAASLLLPVGTATADPVSSCTASRGVLVAVDFRHFGGSVTRGCDATPSTGYDALHAAGFTTEGTHHDGDGFVCRIDNHPNVQQEPCFNTPPASAYWSYWHADRGSNSWTYSKLGAQSTHPGDGSVDAWVFGGTNVGGTTGGPSFSPADVRATASGSAGGTSQHTRSSHGGTTRHGGEAHTQSAAPRAATHGAAGRRGSHRAATGHSARGAASSTAPRAGSTASSGAGTSAHPAGRTPVSAGASIGASTGAQSAAASGRGPSIVDATPVSADGGPSTKGGSPVPVILGVGLALVLGGGAAFTMLRRRRAES